MHDLRSECKIKVVGWYEECEGVVFVICLFMGGGEGVVFFNLKRFFRFSFATKLEKGVGKFYICELCFALADADAGPDQHMLRNQSNL